MSIVESIVFLIGWFGWLVALALQIQVRNERETAYWWMRRHYAYKRENPPKQSKVVTRAK